MRINQPIGFFLLIWPTLWGLWMSNRGIPDFFTLIIFIIGAIIMRSAGCVINDYIDCDIDIYVQRTKHRPLSSRIITKKKALLTFIYLIIFAAGLICVFDTSTILLALLALGLLIIYPFLKRYVYLPQLILGILFSWPILMAYTATCHVIDSTAWLLFLVNTVWTIIYDTEYSMVDRDDDKKIGIKSSALLFGNMDKLIIGILQIITIFMFIFIGYKEKLPIVFYCFSVCGGGLLFVWQQILIHHRIKKRYFKAFLNNNYVGLLVFIGIALSFI
nr:4-hydroxybenzoate octaprenyltransferase [Candidatus Blochmannia vafer]